MPQPTDDPFDDAWIQDLVDFDEALRLGRPSGPVEKIDGAETRQFLLKLQSIWPRAPKKLGAYTMIGNLGQGTLGMTYQVEDSATKQPYVLKVVWPELCGDTPTRALLAQAAVALGALRHTQVAAFRELRESGPVCCVISEYCPGPSLAQWRHKHPEPLPWAVAARVIAGLAETLDIAHRHGVGHGNLKPGNIFLPAERDFPSGQLHEAALKIADFALAKAAQHIGLSSDGGLPWPMAQYLAPEQLRHRTRVLEPASDLFALGVLAYELLTGRCPVKGNTRDEILANTLECMPPLPRQFRPDLPRELESLVLTCLQKNPRERPVSAKHLAADLRGLVGVDTGRTKPTWWRQWLGWQ